LERFAVSTVKVFGNAKGHLDTTNKKREETDRGCVGIPHALRLVLRTQRQLFTRQSVPAVAR